MANRNFKICKSRVGEGLLLNLALMGPVPNLILHRTFILLLRIITMSNAIIMSMLDSNTITAKSTTAEVIAKVEEVMNAPKVALVASSGEVESADDILMFGC